MSELRPRVDAMRPSRPGPTRTADPRPPDGYPGSARYLRYLAFGSCGIFLMLGSLGLLRLVFALGQGPVAYARVLDSLTSPVSIGLHAFGVLALVWFSLRFFGLFPKTQPPRIGPAPRPPDAVFAVALNGAFALVNAGLVAILWGAIL
jgi:fumarate reductase subunit C